ncbi:MAG: class I SAM-dependent methyltransferase [Wenzhouxiangellaceae bacterium]
MLGMILLLSASAAADERLRQVIDDPARPEAERARDVYRHPYETLSFFGIQPTMTVVELSPGSGWYTEILAPYLAAEGRLIVAHIDPEREGLPEFYKNMYSAFIERFSDRERYGEITVVPFDPPRKTRLGDPGTADMVLSFRSVHGWKRDGIFGDVLDAAREVLKPGGVLGIVQHRLPEDRDGSAHTGYVKQSWVVAMAESHGFRLDAASEVNANPRDSADHPEGVWNLPPTLRNVPEDQQAQWREIGESDRMTLRFVKR